MFWIKIRKKGIPLPTPVFLYKMGLEGVFNARTCFPDVLFIAKQGDGGYNELLIFSVGQSVYTDNFGAFNMGEKTFNILHGSLYHVKTHTYIKHSNF